MRRFILWTSFIAVFALPAAAQQRPPAFATWRAADATGPIASSARSVPPDSTLAGARRDHRYEGMLIGGIAAGALGAWIGSGISASADCLIQPGGGCGSDDNLGSTVVGGLIGAALGGSLGYVIGRWGGKPQPTLPDSTTR